MGQVIELCRSCGFDIPGDADACPSCGPKAVRPSRAARQVAGLALPTRSVHRLARVAPRREVDDRPLGEARAARSAFSFTVTLVLVTFSAAGLAWLAGQPRFVLQVPAGTVDRLDAITTVSAAASVAMLVFGLLAMVAWSARAVRRSVRQRHRA